MTEEKQKELRKKICIRNLIHVLILVLIFLGTAFLLNRKPWEGYAIPRYRGTSRYAEPGWVFRKGDTVLETGLKPPAFRHMETGETYSLSAVLTYDGSGDQVPYCFYFVDHMYTRVLLDGEELFHYLPEDIVKREHSRSPGNVYAGVQLPHDCRGKELTIEFIPALSEKIEFQLPNPVFSDYATEAARTFRQELPQNLVALAAVFLGIASILFSTMMLSGSRYREGLFIGIFATLYCLYNLTESNFAFYVISNPYYTYVLDYTTFTLLPVFLMAFLRERLDPRQKKVVTGMIVTAVIVFLLEETLHFTGLLDMREFLIFLHVMYGLDLVIIFFLVVTMENNRWKTQLILQLIPILLGILIDASVYYLHWNLGSGDSGFTALGVILFLSHELYNVWHYSIDVYEESVRSQEYRAMACVDALTGIGNRRAFERDRQKAMEKNPQDLFLASVDINNLKYTNDTLGHEAGDFLIRSAAEVLEEFSSERGLAYRVGGDEFIVLMYQVSKEDLRLRLNRMEERLRAVNQKSRAKLGFSIGYEFCSGRELDRAFLKADQKMYSQKRRIKGEESAT